MVVVLMTELHPFLLAVAACTIACARRRIGIGVEDLGARRRCAALQERLIRRDRVEGAAEPFAIDLADFGVVSGRCVRPPALLVERNREGFCHIALRIKEQVVLRLAQVVSFL